MDIFSIILGMAGVIVGIVSVRIAVIQGRRARYAERARTFYDWPLLQTAARELARQLQTRRQCTGLHCEDEKTYPYYKERIVLGIHGGGTILAQLLVFELDEAIPLRTVAVLPRNSHISNDLKMTHSLRQTTKFDIYVPKELSSFQGRQFIVVDDCATTGQSLSETAAVLRDMQHTSFNTITVAAVCCTSAISARNAPSLFWATSETDDVYFPWGSGRRLQRYVKGLDVERPNQSLQPTAGRSDV